MATKITLSLPDDTVERLKKLAKVEERAISAVVKRALDAYFKNGKR